MKKLKFKDFFLKRLIIWIVVAILTTALAFGVAVLSCQWYAEFAAVANTNQASLYIQRADNKGRTFFNLGLCFDDLFLKGMAFNGAAVIVDSETEEIYMDSEYNGFAVIKKQVSPTGESVILPNKSDEFLNTMSQFEPIHNIYIDIENIYVDEDGFYPGVTTIGILENDWDVIPENIEVYNFTPENAAELQEYSEGIMSLALGTHPDSEVLKAVRNGRQIL